MTLKADKNQQSPKRPWITSLDSTPSSKNFASPIDIWSILYHSICAGFISFWEGPILPYNENLFNLPSSFGWEPNSVSINLELPIELKISSHFFIAASSLFKIVSHFFPFISK